jgi:hypothetical protein
MYELWKTGAEDFPATMVADDFGDDVAKQGWFTVQTKSGTAVTDPLQFAFSCNCDCYEANCGWSTSNSVAAIFMCVAAALIALDAFLKLDYKIEKMVDVATELTHIGWEFASLSGDFKPYGTHQDAFTKFAAKVEISIGKIPASWLPDDQIFEEDTYEDEQY